MKLAMLLSSLLFSVAASAAAKHDCGYLDSVGYLMEPPKTFGSVRVAYVSTDEPVAAPDHILVYVYDNEMGVTCTAISLDREGTGFGWVDMSSLKSIGYNAKTGRLLQITAYHPQYDGERGRAEVIRFRASAITGKVKLQ